MAQVADVSFKDNSGEVIAEMKDKALDWLDAIGQDAASTTSNIIASIPLVDTGRLMNSIEHAVESGEMAVYIGTNVHNDKGHNYAIDHEFGTSRGIPAKHFLQAGASIHGNEYKEMLERIMEEE